MGDQETYMQEMLDEVREVCSEVKRPSVLFQQSIDLSLDGNAWLALMGSNIMEGVCGSGDSPDAAMRDFDRAFEDAHA